MTKICSDKLCQLHSSPTFDPLEHFVLHSEETTFNQIVRLLTAIRHTGVASPRNKIKSMSKWA